MNRFVLRIAPLVLATSTLAWSQAPHNSCKLEPEQLSHFSYQFKNVTQQESATEVLTALRNMTDSRSTTVVLVPEQHTVVMRGCPEDIDVAKKILQDLDQVKPVYRLTFTLTEVVGNKRQPSQKFTLDAVAGQRARLKQGTRIPVTTGTYSAEKGAQNQIQYLDVGVNIDVTPSAVSGGVLLTASVERSSVTADHSVTTTEPVIAQSTLQSTLHVSEGKEAKVGTIALPENQGQLEVEVSYTSEK